MFFVDLEPHPINKEIFKIGFLSNMKIKINPPKKEEQHHPM